VITGSGNKYVSTVHLDERNASAQVWWCEGKQEWHWMLVWEDGSGAYGTHMASGAAHTKIEARANIVKHMLWAEDWWPKPEYFDGP
jgi:hypothetical protein